MQAVGIIVRSQSKSIDIRDTNYTIGLEIIVVDAIDSHHYNNSRNWLWFPTACRSLPKVVIPSVERKLYYQQL